MVFSKKSSDKYLKMSYFETILDASDLEKAWKFNGRYCKFSIPPFCAAELAPDSQKSGKIAPRASQRGS